MSIPTATIHPPPYAYDATLDPVEEQARIFHRHMKYVNPDTPFSLKQSVELMTKLAAWAEREGLFAAMELGGGLKRIGAP